MNKSNDSLNIRDREFAQVLRATLEQKAQQPDPLLEAALASARIKAQEKAAPRRHRVWWMAGGMGVALAAGLAVVAILPHNALLQNPETPAAEMVAMPDADLQLLESMDMLVAMQ